MVPPPPSWPGVLQTIITSPAERQRLATALGVASMTLSRWASGESKPHKQHLIHLLQAVQPSQRNDLIKALESMYSDIHTWLKEDTNAHVPSEFFSHVLNMRTTTTESLRFWRISELVLKQALAQLDPNNLGMAVKLVACMKPGPDGKIRSLRERAGKGTPPWTADLEHDVLFLGMESLSGSAVDERHMVSSNDLRTKKTYPTVIDDYEISAAAHPIRFEGRIAGCLLASSTQPDYFSSQRQKLLATFSDLIALAFDQNDFYNPNHIDLRVMPPPQKQRPLLADYRQRVMKKFQEARQQQQRLTNAQIELLAWQDLENELLAYRGD